jgi:hypothetical protein
MGSSFLKDPPKLIEQNKLLHTLGKTIKLKDFLALREAAILGEAKFSRHVNLVDVPENLINRVFETYGEEGLFQLLMLSTVTKQTEFDHFMEPIKWILDTAEMTRKTEAKPLNCDNTGLKKSSNVERFNTNFLQPSFSRKLYRAGRHHGSLVYGLGGPRILVSHPFQGRIEDIYDLYANSVDVVTSLCLRGFHGMFQFLDFLPGLDQKISGTPAWLIWFSVIAAQSDLVIYVKEYDGDFGWAQNLEIDMTPDHVRKCIVNIPHDELGWAKKADLSGISGSIYVGDDGKIMSEEEWYKMEAEYAMPFIKNYVQPGIPKDRFFVIDESGKISNYRLNYSMYTRT